MLNRLSKEFDNYVGNISYGFDDDFVGDNTYDLYAHGKSNDNDICHSFITVEIIFNDSSPYEVMVSLYMKCNEDGNLYGKCSSTSSFDVGEESKMISYVKRYLDSFKELTTLTEKINNLFNKFH